MTVQAGDHNRTSKTKTLFHSECSLQSCWLPPKAAGFSLFPLQQPLGSVTTRATTSTHKTGKQHQSKKPVCVETNLIKNFSTRSDSDYILSLKLSYTRKRKEKGGRKDSSQDLNRIKWPQLQHNWTQLTYRAAAEPSLARGWPPTAARPSVPFQSCPENKESP